MNYNKRYSLPHWDKLRNAYEDVFLQIANNTPQEFFDEIHDIYFGKFFRYEHEGKQKIYGNAMGVEASDRQIDNLLKIQEKFGVEVSLTMNSLNVPHEILYDKKIHFQFIDWIQELYDKGLRSCTIASEHLIRFGVLQERMPEMRWKSTVNQICADAQQFVDMVYNGYDTILLDRSLNRNFHELKKIKKAQDMINNKLEGTGRKKILTSLLIKEGCVYRCPFKREHDGVGEFVSTDYFNDLGNVSCVRWKALSPNENMPRMGIDIVMTEAESFKDYLEYVDILKYSGRFTEGNKTMLEYNSRFVWTQGDLNNESSTMKNIIDNNLSPIMDWVTSVSTNDIGDYRYTRPDESLLWYTEKGQHLEKVLRNCKSQCWDCHECEDVFGTSHFDSVLEF